MLLKVLGSGSAQGIPQPLCSCELCQTAHGKDRRFRNSYLVELENGKNILLDASPDWSHQQLESRFDFDFLFLSHRHRDHTQGLEDLRIDLEAHDKKRSPSQKQRVFLLGKGLHNWLYGGPRNTRWQESTQQAYQQLLFRKFFRSLILTPYEKVDLTSGTQINYLRGLHGKHYCGGLAIRENEKLLVYLADIAKLNDKLGSFLNKMEPDLIIVHVPFFYRPQDLRERERHLGVEDVKNLPAKKILLSHFSHRVRLPHEKLVQEAAVIDPRLIIAFDRQTLRL